MKPIVGLTEKIELIGPTSLNNKLVAKVDTGATIGSIDIKLAAELQLGPIIKTKRVKQAQGIATRAIVEAIIDFAGRKFKTTFTLADRSHMKYRVLIGQNQMKGIMIDPAKKG